MAAHPGLTAAARRCHERGPHVLRHSDRPVADKSGTGWFSTHPELRSACGSWTRASAHEVPCAGQRRASPADRARRPIAGAMAPTAAMALSRPPARSARALDWPRRPSIAPGMTAAARPCHRARPAATATRISSGDALALAEDSAVGRPPDRADARYRPICCAIVSATSSRTSSRVHRPRWRVRPSPCRPPSSPPCCASEPKMAHAADEAGPAARHRAHEGTQAQIARVAALAPACAPAAAARPAARAGRDGAGRTQAPARAWRAPSRRRSRSVTCCALP